VERPAQIQQGEMLFIKRGVLWPTPEGGSRPKNPRGDAQGTFFWKEGDNFSVNKGFKKKKV